MATNTSGSAQSGNRPAKKAAAKKSAPSKKAAPAKKAPARRDEETPTSQPRASSSNGNADNGPSSGSGGGSTKRPGAAKVARLAVEQLTGLTGRVPECVVGVERNDDGWLIEVEVVESARIPDSTDIMATYRVECDEDGELIGYHRSMRYVRGKADNRD